jgi:hypothetical protein
MKPPRSALPLPRYVRRRPLKSGLWGYFFEGHDKYINAGCPIPRQPLGADYVKAVERAETVLLPALDEWRTGVKAAAGLSVAVDTSPIAAPGTLDWVFAEYRADRRFAKLDPRTKRNHEVGFRMVGGYVLKDGRRLGTLKLAAIDTSLVDELYGKLLVVKETNVTGDVIERERRTTVNHAMKTCRRAWNVADRRNPGKLPIKNPFAAMGLESSDRETPTATFSELQAFRAKAIEMGFPSLATAALIGWEWLQREVDIFATFEVAHYRPKEQPNAVRIVHEKTREQNWIPLFDDQTGAPFSPVLMAELDAIKKTRIAGLMLRRDWGKHDPWPTFPKEGEIDLTHMSRKVKEVIRAAGLRDELTFTSFRHGGFTEAGNADLTDRELMAQGRHKSPKVLSKYVKRTMRQVAKGLRKRHAERTKGGQVSGMSNSTDSGMED